ncbi:MAG: glucose-1-phosphate thymidylyltransferase [Ectothiorhodospiraceae bacterium]|nr:MAG: glucose-1-phosphate thymidylyltransferase [Ectothiorhodospiraceae bacterium]
MGNHVDRKGIILAGGKGTRLYPLTKSTSKCILPVYDKPMIYYSLATLMMSGIRDILVISTPDDIKNYSNLIGDGKNFGINVSYEIQPSPDGIAQALIIAENFLTNHPSALMLADNIFYGDGLESKLVESSMRDSSTVFSYEVHDPERFGICEIDDNNRVISLEEKPAMPKSNLAVTGLYFYDSDAPQIAKNLEPSDRGELEITDVNIEYMKSNNLYSEVLNDSYMWIDAGTQESFLMASNYVKSVEDKTGMKILCPEEIAFKKGYISSDDLCKIAEEYSNSEYGKYLKKLIA